MSNLFGSLMQANPGLSNHLSQLLQPSPTGAQTQAAVDPQTQAGMAAGQIPMQAPPTQQQQQPQGQGQGKLGLTGGLRNKLFGLMGGDSQGGGGQAPSGNPGDFQSGEDVSGGGWNAGDGMSFDDQGSATRYDGHGTFVASAGGFGYRPNDILNPDGSITLTSHPRPGGGGRPIPQTLEPAGLDQAIADAQDVTDYNLRNRAR